MTRVEEEIALKRRRKINNEKSEYRWNEKDAGRERKHGMKV